MKALRHLVLAALLVAGIGPLAAAPVDINSADAATLAAAINGVGPSRAAAIISYREANGPFASVDELTAIRGIGPKLLERNREVISVGGQPTGELARALDSTFGSGVVVPPRPATSTSRRAGRRRRPWHRG